MSSPNPMLQNNAGDAAAGGVLARVLVVDDDASVCAALGRLLGLSGYAVTAFRSAEAFLAQHDPRACGCIILDVAMPGQNGLALQQALAQRGNQMPIIF
ncbi:MAG TPA: response regulator, partial [Burkholderiaceae bacterium]